MKVAFIGNMNNITFNICEVMQSRGIDVTFFIDVPKSYILDRPESWNNELWDNLPCWMVDLGFKNSIFKIPKFLTPGFFYKNIIRDLNSFDAVFLNGNWVSLGSYLNHNVCVINIYAGLDLEMCDKDVENSLIEKRNLVGYRKFIPRFIYELFWKRLAYLQSLGIKRSNIINYYAPGISPVGEAVIDKLKCVNSYSRLPVRGFPTSRIKYVSPDLTRKTFVILSATRFYYLDKNRVDNKRNDIMLLGIAKFIEINKIVDGIEIILFEKGDDLNDAKLLCEELKIAKFVKWEKVITFDLLLDLFAKVDVAFDQLGDQWIGVGSFSMLVGRPLIANARLDVFSNYFDKEIPILHSLNSDDVCAHLTKLYLNRTLVLSIGQKSREYILDVYNIEKNVDFYIEKIREFFSFQNAIN